MPRKLEELGQIIETARVDKDYSREKLSELVGVSTKHIYNIEHNGARLFHVLVLLFQYLYIAKERMISHALLYSQCVILLSTLRPIDLFQALQPQAAYQAESPCGM